MSKQHGKHGVWAELMPDAELERVQLTMAARSMVVARRALHGPLPSDLIHDPALDMLLALYVSEADGGAVPVAELLATTSVSRTVAQRWLAVLVAEGLAARDGGSVSLAEAGGARMTETIRAVIRSQVALRDK